MVKHEPEIRRAKARRYVESCNRIVHGRPGRRDTPRRAMRARFHEALELAEHAYEAHALPYQAGLSNMRAYPPARFTWVVSDAAENFVKVRDDLTGKLADWRWFYP